MPSRRAFLRSIGGATAGVAFASDSLSGYSLGALQSGSPGTRREVRLAGRRIRTVDVHAHCYVTEVWPLVQSQPWASGLREVIEGARGRRLGPDVVGPERLRAMDTMGIDVQALSINPYWYTAERELARDLIEGQNRALAAVCAKYPGRFIALATVALQYPDLAAEQLEAAVTKMGHRGAAIACNIRGDELAHRKFDPFWKKAEDLRALVFLHPQGRGGFDGERYPAGMNARLEGLGNLNNIIGHPLETTIALSHLIFEGTLDRFPGLRLCGGHGGGFMPSYIARFDATCEYDPENCKVQKKKASAYFKDQIYCDSKVFTTEGLRHLVAEFGAGQIVMGTDHPAPWPVRGVDQILETPGLSDAEKEAILGGNLTKLLRLDNASGF